MSSTPRYQSALLIICTKLTVTRFSDVGGSTVAARIRALQDASAPRGQASPNAPAQRAMTQALNMGTTTGRGRRKSPSFASPAIRSDRDGNEGIRGDGRPPVGKPMTPMSPLPEPVSSYRGPLAHTQDRPHTSTDFIGRNASESDALRSHTSMGDVDNLYFAHDEHKEYPAAKIQDSGTVKRRSLKPGIIEELDEMLEEAIDDNIKQVPTSPSTRQASICVQRSNSHRVSTYQDSDALRQLRSRSISRRRATISTNKAPVDDPNAQKQISPVKSKAAIYEGMGRRFSPPRAVHTPPIPLALPLILEQRRQSSSQSSDAGYATAPSSEETPRPASISAFLNEQKESRSWPFKSRVFGKGKVASPRETEIVVSASPDHDLHAGPGRDREQSAQDKQNGTELPIPSDEIPQLLRKEAVHSPQVSGQRHSVQLKVPAETNSPMLASPELNQFKSRPTVRLEPGEVARRRAKFDSPPIAPQHVKQTRQSKPSPVSQHARPTLLLHCQEKETVNPPTSATPNCTATPPRAASRSPTKHITPQVTPSTPKRGRHSARVVEQRFAISRSRSASSRGVHVNVEVRASPERPSTEAIVVVRTRVESEGESQDEAGEM